MLEMQYRQMGRSGLKVSAITLGTLWFGRKVDEAAARAIVDRAPAAGVNCTPAGMASTSNSSFDEGTRDMVTITAKVKLQSGAGEQFLEAYRWMRPQVLKDPGALLYVVHPSAVDPDEFLFYEQYESDEAFQYHLSTEHFKALAARIDPLMAAPPEIGKWVEAG